MKPFINEKCDADWMKMNPANNGKFCAQCSKNVVDFTHHTDKEIKIYLAANQNVCGRFNSTQIVNTSLVIDLKSIGKSKLSPIEKFALLAFFVFGLSLFSCNNQNSAMGDIIIKGAENQIRFKSKLPIDFFDGVQKIADGKEKKRNKTGPHFLETIIMGDVYELPKIISGAIVPNSSQKKSNYSIFDWPKMYNWSKNDWDRFNRIQLRKIEASLTDGIKTLINFDNEQ